MILFLYSFTMVNSLNTGTQYEVEAEFRGDLNNIFSLLKLNKIFTQMFNEHNVLFTNKLTFYSIDQQTSIEAIFVF